MQASLSVSRILTIAEVAQILGNNQLTVRRWIDAKQLRAMKVGRQWRILRDDLEAFMNAGANKAAKEAVGE